MKQLALYVIMLCQACAAMADATVTRVIGDAQSITPNNQTTRLTLGQQLASGTRIETLADGLVTLRFDDGELVALEKNTTFTIENYKYNEQRPQDDSAVFRMLRGSLRFVTGLLGKRNPSTFALNTPTATIGIRGSDWMAALHNNALYTGVNSGSIAVTNGANSLVVGASQFSATIGTGASSLVASSALPAGIFGGLPALPSSGLAGITTSGGVGAGGAGAASAGAGTGAAAGAATGLSATALGAAAVGAAAVAATASTNSTSSHAAVTHSATNH